ncbi:MAG: cytochrome C oxidase subunit IV family protein [Acidobacteria bacterium]|nr:cytochrome C oxidase subunit IV family protein [Acidobacteriota bacterium]
MDELKANPVTEHAHVVSLKIYFAIFGALMLLTYLTVQLAFLDLGRMNTTIALAIAVLKATLVILYFMHVRYSTRLTKLVVVAALLWLAILLALTMADYLTRGWLNPPATG